MGVYRQLVAAKVATRTAVSLAGVARATANRRARPAAAATPRDPVP
jgi:hypothetical protein